MLCTLHQWLMEWNRIGLQVVQSLIYNSWSSSLSCHLGDVLLWPLLCFPSLFLSVFPWCFSTETSYLKSVSDLSCKCSLLWNTIDPDEALGRKDKKYLPTTIKIGILKALYCLSAGLQCQDVRSVVLPLQFVWAVAWKGNDREGINQELPAIQLWTCLSDDWCFLQMGLTGTT